MREQNLEQVKSLVGKIDTTAMGQQSSRSKPKRAAKKSKPKVEEGWKFRCGDILEEKFDETLYYRPKTKENKVVFESYLGKIY